MSLAASDPITVVSISERATSSFSSPARSPVRTPAPPRRRYLRACAEGFQFCRRAALDLRGSGSRLSIILLHAVFFFLTSAPMRRAMSPTPVSYDVISLLTLSRIVSVSRLFSLIVFLRCFASSAASSFVALGGFAAGSRVGYLTLSRPPDVQKAQTAKLRLLFSATPKRSSQVPKLDTLQWKRQ